jgi:hypothetical protein
VLSRKARPQSANRAHRVGRGLARVDPGTVPRYDENNAGRLPKRPRLIEPHEGSTDAPFPPREEEDEMDTAPMLTSVVVLEAGCAPLRTSELENQLRWAPFHCSCCIQDAITLTTLLIHLVKP